MIKKNLLLLFIVLVFGIRSAFSVVPKSSMQPENLRCEYLNNPIGLDELIPRLNWTYKAVNPAAYGQKQTAYRIIVASDMQLLNQNRGDEWDSGWIASDQMQQIEYKGKGLRSDRYYYWKVAAKDEKGIVSGWSKTAYWVTGLLQQKDWKAKWVGTDQLFDPSQKDCNISDPWLRKTFSLKLKPEKAVIFLASVGYHELYVNGKKISNDVLAPAVTDHTKRARYVAYDIAAALEPGKNVIGIWLGTSWSIFGPYVKPGRPNTPIVIAQLAIYNKKNAGAETKPVMVVQTDESWKTHESPNKLLGTWDFAKMGGELWDANKEVPDWNTVTCDETSWNKAVIYQPDLILSAQNVEPNRVFDQIKSVGIEARPDGSYRVDMGVNFAGWTEVDLMGNKGDRIEFEYSERAQADQTFNLHSAYIIGESGKGTFRNRFNYSSGRWITIHGLKYKPRLSDVRGWMVRTNFQTATSFECSDTLQNWIYNKVRWTFENLAIGGFVVDCPQRERLGYGGDAHATCETGMYNYKLGAFYTKWMQDWRDVQGTESIVGNMYDPKFARTDVMSGRIFNNGILPHTAPTYSGGGGPAWGGIVVSLPWFVYQHEGDQRILERNFELIKGWLAFLDLHTKDDILQRFGGSWDFLGDWLWPGATAAGMNNDKEETLCLNNSYRVFNLRTAAKIARVIGKNEEAGRWEKQAERCKAAIHSRFYRATDQSYADGSMSNLAAALLAEIPPADLRAGVMKRLEKDILVLHKGHINVGITGGAILFKLLRQEGRDDLIYSMTSQKDYPGWGYMKANGATTIWEMWEKDLPGHSLLHSSYLYPGAWYVEGVAGIQRDPGSPGFQKFLIKLPALKASSLSWAKASFDSPAGLIKTSWERKGRDLNLELSVPPNCTAVIQLAENDVKNSIKESDHLKIKGFKDGYGLLEVSSGRHNLRLKSIDRSGFSPY
ncbi:alpha-L-rhamnosidase [Pedobacter sp. ok626]|uniref:family 78 glycoside hydrolase catalytic domain n=1 Tax=Pedobacter sp. ok626 TaxID=1761882 RepID=UPI000882B6D2|nr:family 78 glycoside hydrolase catalytic domain [Pedobacter sp. ok626]SDJ03924.1 alpha-L-rhamnosidase [Pedobacter sp. ok626]